MKRLLTTIAALALAALTGCSSLPQSRATTMNQATAPLFTEEEKAAMTVEERAEIYNENVPERDRVVCRRERRVGSHMPVTICRTQTEIDEERQAARDVLSERDPYSWRPQPSAIQPRRDPDARGLGGR